MANVLWLVSPSAERDVLLDRLQWRFDVFMPDLEDSVPDTPQKKETARRNIADIAEDVPENAELCPRINGLDSDHWRSDVRELVPARPDGIAIAKVEEAALIADLVAELEDLETEHDVSTPISIVPTIEGPRGLRNTYELATADERVETIAFGESDYSASLGALRDDEKRFETIRDGLDYTRGKFAVDAAAANVGAITGSPFTHDDAEYIFEETNKLARMGFTGRMVIHPDQIDPIRRGFAPSEAEVRRAKRVLEMAEAASRRDEAAIETTDDAADIGNTKITESVVRQSKFLLERHEHLGSRESI